MAAAPENERFRDIIRRAAAGDERAWREIVETFSRRVFGLLLSQCGNAELAEEITQSAFCTIVTKISEYTEVGKFENWLFRIAMNRLRDEMRRRKRQATPVGSDVLAALAGGTGRAANPGPPDAALAGALVEAIEELSEKERRVIDLRHRGELSFHQIALLMDEPLGTVLARHHRTLKKLRSRLTSGEAEP